MQTTTVLVDRKRPKSKFGSLLALLAPYFGLLLFTALLLWPLCQGRALFWGDISFYFQPMAAFSQFNLRQGHIPLWNPYVLCGQPLLGNPQMGIFYPATALLALLPVWLYFSVTTLLHVFLCGAFSFLYLRRWTVRQTSAAAGALVYMGSSCLIGRLQFPPMILTAPYLPLLLMLVDRYVDRPRPGTRIGIAITVCLTVLAAHTQMAYMTLLCVTLYASLRVLSQLEGQRGKTLLAAFVRTALPLVMAGALGVMLTSIQTLPSLQLLKASTREALTAVQANRFVFQPQQLWTLFNPHFFGHPAQGDYWGGGNAWEPALFIGWLPLPFLGYALLRCSRERLVQFWSILAFLGLWLALGINGGLYWLAFYAVPGLANFHDPARFLYYTTFGFAVLTAVGLDALRERTAWCSRSVCRVGLVLIALPLIVFGREWNPTTSVRAVQEGEREEKFVQVNPTQGRVYLPEHNLYWNRFVTDGYSDYGPTGEDYVTSLRGTLIPNLPMGQGVAMAAGYEPVPISAPAAIDGLARTAFRRGEPNTLGLLKILQVDTVAMPRFQSSSDPGMTLLTREDAEEARSLPGQQSEFRAVREPLPRAWLVRRTVHIEGKMRVAAALTAPDFDPAALAVVTGNGAHTVTGLTAGQLPDPAKNTVRIQAVTPTEMDLIVDAGRKPAFLVYSGTAYPGWSARLDSHQRPVVRTDGAFLGLAIPPGKHSVRLEYHPAAFQFGAYLSLLAVAMVMCWSVREMLLSAYWRRPLALSKRDGK